VIIVARCKRFSQPITYPAHSIILTNGNAWKVQRSAGHAAFANPINLKYFLDQILPKHLDKLFGDLDKAAQTTGKAGEIVDLQEVAYHYAMAVFGELAYDVSFSADYLAISSLKVLPILFCSPTLARSHRPLQDPSTERRSRRMRGSSTRFTGSPSSSCLPAPDLERISRTSRGLVTSSSGREGTA